MGNIWDRFYSVLHNDWLFSELGISAGSADDGILFNGGVFICLWDDVCADNVDVSGLGPSAFQNRLRSDVKLDRSSHNHDLLSPGASNRAKPRLHLRLLRHLHPSLSLRHQKTHAVDQRQNRQPNPA